MGLDISLYDWDKFVDEKSEKHPEHSCNKGYLRSSYNNSGFNNVVGTLIGKEMHYIFDPIEGEEDEEGYLVHPVYSKEHLETALLRAMEVRDELAQALPFKTQTLSAGNVFDKTGFVPMHSLHAFDAYVAFKAKLTGQTTDCEEAFTHFNKDAPPIYAVLEGVDEWNTPAFHIVTKVWNEPVVQTITCALSHPGDCTKLRKTVKKEGVLSIFRDHEKDNQGKSYACYDGHFYLNKPLDAQAIVTGCDFLGQPALHVIHAVSEEYLHHYQKQADIIIEFIEKALTLKKPRIVWSA